MTGAGREDRLVRRLGAALCAVVALAFPAGFLAMNHATLSSSVQARTEVKAEIVTRFISASPDMWRFEEHRLNEMLVRMPPELPGEQASVVDADGTPVAASMQEVPGPVLVHRAGLYDAGRLVGHVVMRASMRPMLAGTGLAALAGLALAGGLAGLLRHLGRRDRQLRQAMHEEQERARVTLDSIADAVVTTDADGRVVYLNPVAERLTQWRLDEARGLPLSDICPLVDEQTMQPVTDPLGAALHQARAGSIGLQAIALLRRDGSALGIEESSAPLLGADGGVTGATLVFRDVTAARRMAQRIAWAATHDALTGLVNRREFETRVEAAIGTVRGGGPSHVACYIDLDQFKVVNDTCGHAAGDALLRQVCARLQACLGPGDTLARLGGDEFGVLMDRCTLARAYELASAMLSTVREFRFTWEGRSFTVSASLGLAVIDAETTGREEVFAAIDTACYAAKDQGRNRICVYRGSDADMARRRTEMDWAARLTDAMRQDRLCLFYQPFMPLHARHGDHRHIEILLRLRDEDGRIVPPGSFLPAAERYNLMPAIDRWVIRAVFSRYHDLAAAMGAPLTCAINLSGTTLNSEGLLDDIRALAAEHRLPEGAICFEVTETAAIHHMRQATQFMAELKQLGFTFALDDFGIGTSSLAYLRTLPVDYLKIDGSFVRNIARDPIDRAMTETINRIGHLMGLRTVGEFAESAEVIDTLGAIGVDFAQGYGVQQPRPIPEGGRPAGAPAHAWPTVPVPVPVQPPVDQAEAGASAQLTIQLTP